MVNRCIKQSLEDWLVVSNCMIHVVSIDWSSNMDWVVVVIMLGLVDLWLVVVGMLMNILTVVWLNVSALVVSILTWEVSVVEVT